MKKRVLSLFMALALCLSMQPTTTFAESAGTVTEQEELSTTGDAVSGNDVSGGDAGDANADVQDAQALINALPDEVTAENADEVEALLGAIDEAMAKLTDEQVAGLDMTRWENICNAMNAPALRRCRQASIRIISSVARTACIPMRPIRRPQVHGRLSIVRMNSSMACKQATTI